MGRGFSINNDFLTICNDYALITVCDTLSVEVVSEAGGRSGCMHVVDTRREVAGIESDTDGLPVSRVM